MFRLNHFRPLFPSSFVILFIFLSGCNSAGSGSETDPEVRFSSGTLAPEESFSYTFENEGQVEYFCGIHAPDMRGRITVSASAGTASRDTVVMQEMQFIPSQLTVAPNTEVVWINRAAVDHTVISGNPPTNDDDGGVDY